MQLITLCLSSLQTFEEEKKERKKRSQLESWTRDWQSVQMLFLTGWETWSNSSVAVIYGQSLSGSLWSADSWFMRQYEESLSTEEWEKQGGVSHCDDRLTCTRARTRTHTFWFIFQFYCIPCIFVSVVLLLLLTTELHWIYIEKWLELISLQAFRSKSI